MLVLHGDSHTDHVPASVLKWLLEKFKDKDGFFIGSVELPEALPELFCGLYGPIMGDPPVVEPDVAYGCRPGRSYESRLCRMFERKTRLVTVIAGPHSNLPCVLYTAFGGPPSPKEVNDPTLKPEEREASVEFWSRHALADPFWLS